MFRTWKWYVCIAKRRFTQSHKRDVDSLSHVHRMRALGHISPLTLHQTKLVRWNLKAQTFTLAHSIRLYQSTKRKYSNLFWNSSNLMHAWVWISKTKEFSSLKALENNLIECVRRKQRRRETSLSWVHWVIKLLSKKILGQSQHKLLEKKAESDRKPIITILRLGKRIVWC